jgi:hypothetical protein
MVQMRGGLGGKQLVNWFNAGVLFMINNQSVRDYLQRVWDRADPTDEMSLNKELPSINYESLNVGWNCWRNNKQVCDEVFIQSWHGMNYQSKLEEIQKFVLTL